MHADPTIPPPSPPFFLLPQTATNLCANIVGTPVKLVPIHPGGSRKRDRVGRTRGVRRVAVLGCDPVPGGSRQVKTCFGTHAGWHWMVVGVRFFLGGVGVGRSVVGVSL